MKDVSLFGRSLTVAAIGGAVMLALETQAVPITWTNSAGGNWNAAVNWSPNQVPGSSDDAFITNAGTYAVTVNANATVNSLTLGGVSGTQTLVLNGNTLTLNNPSVFGANGTFSLSGGTFNGAGSLTINGSFNWTGGTIGNTGGVTLNGTSTFSGGGTFILNNNSVLANAGTLTWSGGTLGLGNGTVTNLSGAVFNITGDVSFGNYGGNNIFGNAGLVEKTGGTGNLGLSPAVLINNGDVQIQSGTLTINNGGSATGSFEVATNTTLWFAGNYTLGASASITGLGTVNFNAGTVNENAIYNFSGSNLLSGATINFNAGGTVNLDGLTMTGGTLGGSAPVAINGPFDWTGGTIGNTGGVTLNGASTFSGGGTFILNNNSVLANAGTLTWSGGTLGLGNGTVTNLSGAVFNITGDVGFGNYGGNNIFGNAGLVEKTGGTGNLGLSPAVLINNGDVQIQSGTLTINTGGSATGSFEVATNTTLWFAANYTLSASASITGLGTVNFNGGTINENAIYNFSGSNLLSGATINFNAGGTVNLDGLTMTGGTLGGSTPVAINGPFNWTGGTIGNTGGVTLNGTSTLSGGGTFILNNNSVLANAGTLTWSGGALGLGNGTVTNLSGAVFNITSDVSFANYGGNNMIGNAGLLEKTGGTGVLGLSPAVLINNGDVQIQSGNVLINSGGSATGSFEVPSGTGLEFAGNYTLNAGSSVTGLGTVNFNNGTINVSGTYNVSGTNLLTGATVNFNPGASIILNGVTLFQGGTLAGALPVAINGPFNWTGGTMGNTGGVTLYGTSTLSGNGIFFVNNNSVLANAGTLTWSGGAFGLGNGTVTNLPGAVFNITSDVGFVNYGGSDFFGNAGLLEKTGGTGITAFSPAALINNGDVQVQSGTLDLNSGGSAAGTFEVPAQGRLYFDGNYTLGASSSVTGAGTVDFNGGTINAGGTYNISGTNLFTGSTVNFSGNYSITNQSVTISSGAVNLNAGGAVNFGGLTMSGGALGGSLPVPVNGPFNWTGGTIQDSGGVTLYGTSTLSGNGLMLLNNSLLANAGILTWSGGTFGLANGTVTNLSGAVFNITGDVGFVNYGGSDLFGNAGLVEKTGGTGTTAFYPASLINNGDVQVQSGTLDLNSGGSATGTFEVPAQGRLYFDGNYTLGASSSVTGAGTVDFNGGTIAAGGTYNITGTNLFTGSTVNFSGNYSITNQSVTISSGAVNLNAGGAINFGGLTMSGGTLGGSLPVPVNGPFNWTGGTIQDSGGVTLYGTSTLSGNGLMLLNNSLLANAGTLTWSGGTFGLANGTVTNLSGAVFNITGDVGFVNYGGNDLFGNAGLVEKTGGTGTTAFYPASLINNGDVQVQSGTLDLNSGGSATGTFEVPAQGRLYFDGNYTLGASSSVTGAGTVDFNGGTIAAGGTYNITGTNLFTGSTVNFSGNYSITNQLVTISSGAVNLNAGGVINFSGLTMTGGTLGGSLPVPVNGPFNWTGGTIQDSGGVTLYGTSTLSGNGLMILNNSLLANAGTLTWSGGTFGLVNGTVTNLSGAVFNITGDVGFVNYGGNDLFGNSGLVEKTGGTGTTAFYPAFFINDGGTLDVESGVVNLNANNSYGQTNATLQFGLGGPADSGKVTLPASVNLGGLLHATLVRNYAPQSGDTISLITYGSHTGSFTNLNLPQLNPGLGWQLSYNSSSVQLQVVANVSGPEQINGSVTDGQGHGVTNVTVFAYMTNAGGDIYFSTNTDLNGNYSLGVSNGIWSVGLQGLPARGYNPVNNQIAVVNNANQTVNFVLQAYAGQVYTITTTINAPGNPAQAGTVDGGGSYPAGSPVTVVATANTTVLPYYFTNWTENGVFQSGGSSYSFIAQRDRQLVANFALSAFSIMVSNNPPGAGVIVGPGTNYYGDTNILTAAPNFGYAFSNWTEGASVLGTNRSLTNVIYANHFFVANYAPTNLSHVVTTATSPNGIASVGGAGTYTNGQTAVLTAPASVLASPNLYLFQNFTLTNAVVGTSNSYSKTFATTDPDNLQYVAVYRTLNIVPQVTNTTANYPNPVPATTNLVLAFRFDRAMNTNVMPTVTLTNAATVLQPTVPAGGSWLSQAELNDTYVTPAITLVTGMDGVNQVFISGASDTNGSLLALTNTLSLTVDATPPVLSNIAADPGLTSANVSWSSSEAASSQVEYGLTTGYGSLSSYNGSLVTTHLLTLNGLTAGTLYHYRVHSQDLAGNPSVSGDNTFTTLAAPDLVVQNLAVSGTLVSGGNIVISWNDANTGAGLTDTSWYDQVMVTNVGTGQVLLNTSVRYDSTTSGNIPSGGSQGHQVNVHLPDGAAGAGTLEIIVTANAYDSQFEIAYNNNSSAIQQTSALANYPDLQVVNPGITNTSLQSGNTMGIVWQDTNSGNAAVTGSFQDRVTIVNLDTAQTLQNFGVAYDVVASGNIGAGQAVNRQFAFTLPDGTNGAGHLLITITADGANNIFEYNGAGTGESNNTNSVTVLSTLAAYPDLAVTNITAPASAGAGQPIQITWADANVGNGPATNAWTDRVFLSAVNAVGGGQLLGTFQVTSNLAAGSSLMFTQTVTLPPFVAGSQWLIVKANAGNSFYEPNLANNSLVSTQAVNVGATLELALSQPTISESAGANALTGMVSRNGDTTADLVVNLASATGTNVSLPSSVTIPAGKNSVNFTIGVTNQNIAGGSLADAVNASAAGFSPASAPLTILLDDPAVLTLSLNLTQVPEDAAPGVATGTVTRNANFAKPLDVTLNSDVASALTVPATVTIPAGQTSVSFPLTPVNDHIVAEDTRRVHVTAVATGFNAVSAMIDVLNVNTATLSLQLANNSVAKGAPSPGTIGTVTCSPAATSALNVLLTVNNTLVTTPGIVTIPAGTNTVNFNINVGDDGLSTGPQTATLVAQILTPAGLVDPNGAASTNLTILDTHGPTLTVAFAKTSIPKGSNTTATITCNTPLTSPLTVNLSAAPASAVTFPAVVVIPQNQTSVSLMVTGVVDNTQTGPISVALTASSPGYNSGVGNLTVSDIYFADLAPVSFSFPSSALTGQKIPVSWVVTNQGLATATGEWFDYVYLAADNLGGQATLVDFETNPMPLIVGGSYTNQGTFYAPDTPGNYWIMVKTDAGDSVQELNKQNNQAITAVPIVVNAAYRAKLTGVSPVVATEGTPITLTGNVYNTQDNSPMPSTVATVRVLVNGTRRVFAVTSDANGNFSYTFQPLANEAGDYTAGADNPYIDTDSNQVSFYLLGMQAIPAVLTAQLLPNTPLTGQLVLSNLTDQDLSGLAISVPDLQGNLATQFTLTNTTLPGNGTVTVGYQLQSPVTRTAQIKFSMTATSAEGAQLNIPATVTVVPLVAQLQANPAYLSQGMLVGTQTVVSFDIVNNGGAASGDLTVQLPATLPWMTLSSPAVIPSIPAGGKATVILTLNPPADLPLTLYQGSLAVANNSAGLSLPFQFRAVSTGKGDLRVTTTDDYTYYVAGAPKVTNAMVTVRDAITTQVIAQTNSDMNGIADFSGLPAGTYTVNATATSHNQFQGTAIVVTDTTNDFEAFMPRQLVSYQWTVTPTEIPDQYSVQLQSVFETEVPVPNVVIDEPKVVLFMFPGEASQFTMTLRNVGLIAAQGVTITPPDDPNYIITPLVSNVGTIPAMSAVTVPVTVQLRAAPAPSPAAKGSGSTPQPQDAGDCPVSISPCLPTVNLNVAYYYPCGGNNVAQQRSEQLALLCEGKDLADKIKSCLKNMQKLAGSQNLASVGCNAVSAFLKCVGANLGPCQTLAISTICGGLTGGVAGAAAAGAPGLPACICAHLSDLPLPSLPSGGGGGGGGGGDLLLPILPTGSYYVSGNPVVTEITFGSCSGSGPEPGIAQKTVTQPVGSISPLKIQPPVVPHASSAGVCAHVRLEIDQQVVLTRTAFTGTLQIENGDSNEISDVQVSLNFQDATNGNAAGDFVTEGPVLTTLTAADGTGTLAGGATGSAVYTFIPTLDAAPSVPETFQIGGTLSYLDNGQQVVVPLLSSPITVYPEAKLDLIYFQQRDVYGDDPFTPQVEPSEPFALGLMVKNVGAGNAHNFTITSGQPKIVDNEKGLLVDFSIIGTMVGDQPTSPSLTASLGDIDPGGLKEVTWDLISSLQGKFISFSATFQHVNDLGATNTSLINSVEIHELTHEVLANRAGDDDLPDFLVNDIPDPGNLPDTLYSSDGSLAPVNVVTNATMNGPVAAGHLQVQLTTTVSNGWNYIQVADPGVGYILDHVVRSDGKVIAMTNDAWTTDRSFPASSTAAVTEYLVHLFDYADADGAAAYTLYYHSTNTTPPAIVQLGPVTPFVQPGAVSTVNVMFSEPVDLSTFSSSALSLTRNGGANLINAGSGVTLSLVSGSTYAINGLQTLTAADGNYQLTLSGSGINDLWGNNAGNVSASVQWTTGNAPVAIQALGGVVPNPRNVPVTSVNVTFSKAINASTFDYHALSLTLNGGPNLVNGSVSVAPVSGNTYVINGLGALTGADGNYVLTVDATAIQDSGGTAGFGAVSNTWTMVTTGPRIVALQPLATNPRNIVVQSLNVTFAQPIDPTTFSYTNVNLSLDGGPNLITSDVTVTPVDSTTYKIANFNWVVGLAGTYNFTVNAQGIADLAGNPGAGSTNETWQMILETPSSPTNLMIAPDTGISSTDGLTDTNSIVLSGNVGATNLIVRVFDLTSDTYLGTANVTDTNFAAPLTFTATGKHQLQLIAVDVAGNVSAPSLINVFLDTTPPTATIQVVSPNPITSPVTNLLVTFSKAINTNTVTAANFTLTRDGANAVTPAINVLSSNTVLVTGLAGVTATNGTYQLALNLTGIQDLAGNSNTNIVTTSWVNIPPNQPPAITQQANVSVQPGQTLQLHLQAVDPEGNSFVFSLDPGAPAGAVITTNGVFSWDPACDQGGTVNSITVRATDNGVPPASSTMTFTVTAGDCVQINIGSTVMQVGTTSSVPVTVFSSAGVTNLSFTLAYPTNRFTNWMIAPSNSVVGAATAQTLTPARTQFNLSAPSSGSLQGSSLLGSIFFSAEPAPSAFVPLTVASVSATKSDSSAVASVASRAGRVVVIGTQSLLEARLATNAQRQVVLYGNPGASYQLDFNTNLGGTNWVRFGRVPMTNLWQNFGVDNGLTQVFYRAWEFSANPPVLEMHLPAPTNASLLLYGQNGTNYFVETATNLAPGTLWLPLTNFTLTNSFQFINVPNPSNQTRFFRARR